MSDVQRYDIKRGTTIGLLDDGEYVKYDDYRYLVNRKDGLKDMIAQLHSDNEKLRARIDELETIRGNSVLVPTDKLKKMQRRIEKLQAQNKILTEQIHDQMAAVDVELEIKQQLLNQIKAEGIRDFITAFDDQMLDMDIFLKEYLSKLERVND